MSRKFVDLKGKKFGKLSVISGPERINKTTYYKCICDCGNNISVRQSSLNAKEVRNSTKSCGCSKFKHKDLSGRTFNGLLVIKDIGLNNDKRHMYECLCSCGNKVISSSKELLRNKNNCTCQYAQHKKTSKNRNLYAIWNRINSRCFNKFDKSYPFYGGRGITVCERWSSNNKNGFINFLDDFESVYIPNSGKSFDRIDNDGDYSLKNVRYVDSKTQSNNRRDNKKIVVGDKVISMIEFSKKLNISYNTVRSYLQKTNPSNLVKNYAKRGKIDRKTYEATKDASWFVGV